MAISDLLRDRNTITTTREMVTGLGTEHLNVFNEVIKSEWTDGVSKYSFTNIYNENGNVPIVVNNLTLTAEYFYNNKIERHIQESDIELLYEFAKDVDYTLTRDDQNRILKYVTKTHIVDFKYTEIGDSTEVETKCTVISKTVTPLMGTVAVMNTATKNLVSFSNTVNQRFYCEYDGEDRLTNKSYTSPSTIIESFTYALDGAIETYTTNGKLYNADTLPNMLNQVIEI